MFIVTFTKFFLVNCEIMSYRNKEERERCYSSRDEYWNCMDQHEGKDEKAIHESCKETRELNRQLINNTWPTADPYGSICKQILQAGKPLKRCWHISEYLDPQIIKKTCFEHFLKIEINDNNKLEVLFVEEVEENVYIFV